MTASFQCDIWSSFSWVLRVLSRGLRAPVIRLSCDWTATEGRSWSSSNETDRLKHHLPLIIIIQESHVCYYKIITWSLQRIFSSFAVRYSNRNINYKDFRRSTRIWQKVLQAERQVHLHRVNLSLAKSNSNATSHMICGASRNWLCRDILAKRIFITKRDVDTFCRLSEHEKSASATEIEVHLLQSNSVWNQHLLSRSLCSQSND